MNETLREAGHATVIVEEQVAARMYTGPHTHSAIAQLPLLLLQVAARMYTGPMYMKYNLVLRGMGAGRHTKIYEEYERVCKLNTCAWIAARTQCRRRTTHASSSAHSRYSSGTRRRST